MIDRQARSVAATLVKQLVDGCISNFDFEERWPIAEEESDRGLQAIRTMMWRAYSDTHEHRLVGDHALSSAEISVVNRCILFLESGATYQWPNDDFSQGEASAIIPRSNPITLGLSDASDRLEEARLSAMKVLGEDAVWPFFDSSEYHLAKSRSG